MNILFLSNHCCIRCVKEGLALIEAGHSVVFLHNRVANPDMEAVLPLQSFYQSAAQLRQKLETFTDMDIIHVHNEPSSLGWVAKEVRPDLPMVFDVHDLNSVRLRRVEEDERRAMEGADGVIFPSQGYRDYCLKDLRYAFPGLADTPSEVIYSMCIRQMLDIPPAPRAGGMVYEGRLAVNGSNKDYRGLFKEIADLNIPLATFASNMNYLSEYSRIGAMVMPTLPYVEMMRQLTRFDWGFSGPAVQCRDGNRALPNKLFEYVTAGIPVMVYQAREAAEFVEAHGIGIGIDDVSEIPKRYQEHWDLRDQVREKRQGLLMESQTDKIVELYKSAERGMRNAEVKETNRGQVTA